MNLCYFFIQRIFVLIETLWNVKWTPAPEDIDAAIVLIETLWNVKKKMLKNNKSGIRVLIETLWNVKTTSNAASISKKKRFNRNIVECKGRTPELMRRTVTVLIETLWNVKSLLFLLCFRNSRF